MSVDVSVIVTSYNVAGYIDCAITSALAQTGVTLEVIVVDDASTDDTWERIQRIRDARVISLRLEKNAGPSAARNAAIARARGEWLAVLDGDDQFMPGRLARLVERARAEKADIIVDNLMVLREVDGSQSLMFPEKKLERLRQLTPASFIAGNSNFLTGYALGYLKPVFSAAFLKAHALGYRETIRIGEDYMLLLSALASGAQCVVEPQAGYLYTARAGSISHRLTKADVARIESEDAALLSRYTLDAEAQLQQIQRTQRLHEAEIYQDLVGHIKAKRWAAAFMLAFSEPLAARHLWLPVLARIERL